MTTKLTIPNEDAGDFADLKDEIRSEVRKWLRAFVALVDWHNGRTAKGTKVGDVIDRVALELRGAGVVKASSKTVRRKWDAFKSTITSSRPCGDWRVFINRAKCPTVTDALPTAFVEFWKGLCGENQRKCAPAYRALIRKWNRGEPIPGYEAEPTGQPLADEATGVPPGWTFRNLLRHKPTKLELKAARQGMSAARAHLPLVRLTRVGTRVGQFYLFDDLWHDFKVGVPGPRTGRPSPQRLLQFHALDLFSGCNIARGYKPVQEDEITLAEERLKEREMLFLVCCVLARDGYRPEKGGTVLVVENRTASITPELEERIYNLTGGCVVVDRAPMQRARAFAGMYFGQSKGNFRFKAALESLGNLIHNETANVLEFPGQTGSNSRLNAPEELHGREKTFRQLANAIVALGPDRGNLFRLPFLDYNKAIRLVDEVHERINQRIEHELEGWLEAGLTTEEFRVDPKSNAWLPLAPVLALPDAQRAAIDALVHLPNMSRVRNLSPREVWNSGASDLIKLPAFNVPQLLGPGFGEERKVKNQLFEFESKELGAGDFRYLAQVKNRFGGESMLKEGEKYLTYVNPLNADELVVCNAGGGYLGTCERWTGVTRGDAEKLNRQVVRAEKVHAELVGNLARRGAHITREKLADLRHNIKVARGAAITPAEKSRRKALKRDVKSLTDADRAAVNTPAPAAETDEAESDLSSEMSRYFATDPAEA